MILASSNFLGVAVTDRAIYFADLSGQGDKASVGRTATFVLPEGMSLDKPEAVGAALAIFLKQHDLDGRKAVVGVPAKWLIAVEKDVPPAGREQMRAMLRLQAERLPLADNGEVVYDYVGEHQANKPGKVLLVAMLRKQLERIEKVMEAAGLNVAAVTPTALALASAFTAHGGNSKINNSPMLFLGRNGAEVVFQRGGSPRSLRHVGVTMANGHGLPAMAPLGAELRRAVSLAPSGPNGQPAAAGGSPAAPDELYLLDLVGLGPDQVSELSERLGWKIRNSDGLAMLGLKGVPTQVGKATEEDLKSFAPVLALAMVGADRALMPLNFAKSRLAPPPVKRFGKKSVWAGVIGALVVISLLALWIDVKFVLQGELDSVVQKRTDLGKKYTVAKAVSDKVDFTNHFINTRTPVLDCMEEITNTFHDDELVYATSLNLQEDKDSKEFTKVTAKLEGTATDMRIATVLANRLRDNPRFSNINGPTISTKVGRQSNGQSTFTIIFTYSPVPPIVPQPQQQQQK